ncbi:MAG: 6-carboxytetrahydropterin synthase [candidate division WOR-3 bacterium]
MAFILKYKNSFRAKHALLSYKGKKEELHEHLYTLIVSINANERNDEGYTIDFMEIKKFIDQLLPNEGENLNERFPFPTSTENIAEYFYEIIKEVFDVKEIELWQDDNFCVIYRK